jgi:serine/threonine-protein kinase RsbW
LDVDATHSGRAERWEAEVPLPDDTMASPVTGTAGPISGVRDVVLIKLPAVGAYLSVLRTATAGLAARLDFTLDEIEDLRIAVDEACAMLLAQAVAGASLECEFELLDGAMRIAVSALTEDGREPSRDTFAWTVLSALAGEVDSAADIDNRVTISLLKHRAETAPIATERL